jgi:radical SAM protein with 4Fe4S-binding SPASM domain
MKITKKRIPGLLHAAWGFLLKKEKVAYFPLRLWIETTSRCNLSCGLCANKDLAPSEKKDMEMPLFKKIIDEAKGLVYDVNLFHRGEPLLNENIYAMISAAKKEGITTRLHSNATLLDAEASKRLLECGLDYLSFSFDGYLKQTYEKNRAGADFEETLKNITAFLRLKKEAGLKNPYTVIQVMEYDEKTDAADLRRQKEMFRKSFRELGLNRFVIRKPHNWGGLIRKIDTGKKNAYNACTFCWYSLTILYDGKVCCCPQDFKAKIVLGDVQKTSIKNIFNAKEMAAFRKKNKNGQITQMLPCRDCDRIYRKTWMGIPVEYLKAFILGK